MEILLCINLIQLYLLFLSPFFFFFDSVHVDNKFIIKEEPACGYSWCLRKKDFLSSSINCVAFYEIVPQQEYKIVLICDVLCTQLEQK